MTGGYIMKEKNIQELAIRMGLISVEDMCQYTIAQLVYMIANKLNELMTNVNQFETEVDDTIKEQNEAIKRLLNEGTLAEVEKIFRQWSKDGTFDRLINQSALKKVNGRIDETNAHLSQNFTDVRFHISQLFNEKMNVGGMISVKQINKNTGKIDQSYLSDELIQMIAGDAPVSMVPADGSITPIKNAYPTLIGEYPSENLLNLSAVTKGHYVSYEDGQLYELASHCVSDYIPVIGGQHYVSTQNEQTAFYDGNKTFISGLTGIGNGGQTIPSNAKYMRMSINIADLPSAMISRDKLPTKYYPCEAKLPPQLIKGYERYIPSETEKIVIIGTKIKFKGDMTLFDTVRKQYIRLSGEYDLPNNGDCLVLNIISGEVKVSNFHGTLHTLDDNFVVLFVEYLGRFLSSIFDERQVIHLETRRNIYVSHNKNADYTTITEAINDCKLAPKNRQYNIIIDDGLYFESLNLYDVNNINLIGVNKNTCIIKNANANYYKAPLATNGAGYFANLSFIATSEQDEEAELTSYAMHYEGDSSGGTCEFHNCYFYSHNNSAVGIGMRKNETLIFNQCEIVKADTKPYPAGAFYCHSSQFNGHSNQHIIVKDCIITSQSGTFLTIDDSNTLDGIGEMGNTGGEMDITFINNNFYSGTLGKSDEGVFLRGTSPMNDNCIIGSVVLHPRSHGNNVQSLNK